MYSKLKRESNEKRSRHTSLEWPRGIHLQLQDAIREESNLLLGLGNLLCLEPL